MAGPTNPEAIDAPAVRGWSLASAAGRIVIGIGMVAAPEPALRALGFTEVSPATAAVGRIAGVRDLVLGLVTLVALEDRDRLRTATMANAVADAGDALAFGAALGTSERTAGARGIAVAFPAAVAGAWTAWRLT
ncbi:MAG TPA: DUF4267 domain-containing protein [Solirubrobacterales bacterium]|nr:DUF4267 domain-containing protein [Solirubrobacterales bacterium]